MWELFGFRPWADAHLISGSDLESMLRTANKEKAERKKPRK